MRVASRKAIEHIIVVLPQPGRPKKSFTINTPQKKKQMNGGPKAASQPQPGKNEKTDQVPHITFFIALIPKNIAEIDMGITKRVRRERKGPFSRTNEDITVPIHPII